ncbi:MAG: ABC transporter permease [Lachnospiraceae bacterium]|nr:ABC transporter permease [Lachnospiraceae bacterium]
MKVNNKKCVRKIARRCLFANKRRNIITTFAIILTAILFTTLFTITLSIHASYETSIFRELGGKNHGTFKDLTDKQLEILEANPHIQSYGVRTVAGVWDAEPFTKRSAEVSYMDDTCAEWSFIKLSEGHMPTAYNEVIMDREALRLLGKEPVLGEEIELSYQIGGYLEEEAQVTDTFVLCGYWDYDPMIPAHFINVSKEYVEQLNEHVEEMGYDPLRTDLNVMFSSSWNLVSKMTRVEAECGFTDTDASAENYVRFGVNPGFTFSGGSGDLSLDTLLPILAFSLLVVFTGYLIIYNVFQISVATDIRFYGLLKTIGTTQKQLSRIIRNQALLLCIVGIPVGLLLGYGLGALLTPAVLKTSTISLNSLTISTSPVIFIAAGLFELLTVLLSVSKPGRMAGKVSPVEALRYTESAGTGKKKKTTRGAKVTKMAFANMERSKKKTVLVFVSLALSLVILNVVYLFVGGFDSEKWLDASVSTDFVVGNVRYFKYDGAAYDPLPLDVVEEIRGQVKEQDGGFAYDVQGIPLVKVNGAKFAESLEYSGEEVQFTNDAGQGMHYMGCVAEGMDPFLLSKMEDAQGDLSLLNDPSGKYVAILTNIDEFGNPMLDENAPKIGEKITLAFAESVEIIDKTTGQVPEDMVYSAPENMEGRYIGLTETECTVCAYVDVPFSIGPRRGTFAYDVVLGADTLKEIVGENMVPMFYAFDTASEADETAAEETIHRLCEESAGQLEYESKAVMRKDFENFKQMFSLLGGILCIIIGFVGILNFMNTVMAGIISRKNELAVLQAIGMTGKQVKQMLMTEGLIYTLGSGILALTLSVVFAPLVNLFCEETFWFYSGHFSVMPFAYVMPVFAILGILVPILAYGKLSRASIVDRIREIG